MAGKKMKARSKKVQKMTRDGLVEMDLPTHSSIRVSRRASDLQQVRNRSPDGKAVIPNPAGKGKKRKKSGRKGLGRDQPNLPDAYGQGGQPGQENRLVPGKKKDRKQLRRARRTQKETAAKGFRDRETGSAKLQENETAAGKLQERKRGNGRLQEKHLELSGVRGNARKEVTGGVKPGQRQRLQYDRDETEIRGADQISGRGSFGSGDEGSEQRKRKGKLQAEKRNKGKAHTAGNNGGAKFQSQETKYSGLIPEKAQPSGSKGRRGSAVKVAVFAGAATARKAYREETDENAAVEAADSAGKGAGRTFRLAGRSVRSGNRRGRGKDARSFGSYRRSSRMREGPGKAQEMNLAIGRQRRHLLQKQRIKYEYAKSFRRKQEMGTAAIGTVDYIKKIGGKVTDFFKENRKVFISIGVLIALMMLIMAILTSCSSLFLQNLVDYSGTSYLSTDQAIRDADLYYTQLEAQLQERINRISEEEPGHEAYRYNIAPIEHDPFILASYLSAKYEVFTFEEVKPELDRLFEKQYSLKTKAVEEVVTETKTVRVGESLGEVVTSGYCSCAICCGIWAGGPTASGVYPTSKHTLAVDASDPIVPMGTKVVMNGVEYTVEDTGALNRYGVAFDVYYDQHSEALAHGHQTWEACLADDNGSSEVTVTRTRKVDTLDVTLVGKSLSAICQNRLSVFKKELFRAYNEVKGNLQMFNTPVEFNWYGRVRSHYGYHVDPSSGAIGKNEGMDLAVPSGMEVFAGLTGHVREAGSNSSYGNYVILQNKHGYEIRYTHLGSREVQAGKAILKGTKIGTAGEGQLHIELWKDGERLNPAFYFETGEGTVFGGEEYTSQGAQELLEEAEKYLGVPYVFGGYSPNGFDCSGFVSWCLTHSGVRNTGRLTAQGLHDICTPVSESDLQPGDLVFFTGTYACPDPVSHVGIYAGGGQMVHCGHPVQYTSIYSEYWQGHMYGYGRW